MFATPLARRLARDRGIDLASLRGSGPRGRIVSRDVETSSEVARTTPLAASDGAGRSSMRVPLPADEIPHQAVPHTARHPANASLLSAGQRDVPHVSFMADCDLDALLALRARLNAGRAAEARLSINDFIVRATAVALLRVPEFHVMWTETALQRLERADIAVAIATEAGFIVPVVRDAGSKPLSVISAEIRGLAAQARTGRLAPIDEPGGAMTVTNLGMRGVRQFTAIVRPPQAAILAVGEAHRQLRLDDGIVSENQVASVTLSIDHRAIDGAVAARWLSEFKGLIQAPLTMLV
ncbi:MAG: 2-oxo acid dehydrogenase subunit E2 [Rhizobiales bacterium]|nr:2-oxo acid dehydrogenase subunit E2 [Hyphomicrobiales bacterium]